MRRTRLLFLPILLLPLAGCGDDDPMGPGGLELFVGTFEATSMTLTPAGGFSIDLIDFGAALTITTEADGDFTWTLDAPGRQPVTQGGSLAVDESGSTVTVDFEDTDIDDIVAEYAFSDGGDTLTLEAEEIRLDIDGDGTLESAAARLVMERR